MRRLIPHLDQKMPQGYCVNGILKNGDGRVVRVNSSLSTSQLTILLQNILFNTLYTVNY